MTPEALLEHLGGLGIEYTLHRHPPLLTVEDSKALRGTLPGGHCKNLFLKDKKDNMWLLVCLEDRRIDLKALGAAIGGARLSFGSPDRLMRVLGIKPGAVSPFALINDSACSVKVLLDQEMMALRPLNYHPLSNDMTIAVEPEDLARFIEACGHVSEVIDLSDISPKT